MAGAYMRSNRSQCYLPLLVFQSGQDSVGGEVGYGGYGHTGLGQGARQPVSEVDGRKHVVLVGVDSLGGVSQPAFCGYLVRLTGVPDVHGTEVRARGVGETDAVDKGDLAHVPKLLHGFHGRVEGELVVYLEHLLFLDPNHLPVVEIKGVVVGYQGVEVVIPAGKLQDDQDRVFLVGHDIPPFLFLLVSGAPSRIGTLSRRL